MKLVHRIRAGIATRPGRGRASQPFPPDRADRADRAAWSDRGDSPIPSTIIIAGLAVIAIALLAWLGTYVLDFLNQAPTDLPEPDF